MPRPRKNALFELAGHWLGVERGRQGFWRFWYDPGAQKTRRARLRAEDLEQAKLELAAFILAANTETDDDPAVSIVMERYHLERTDALRSSKPARAATRTVLAFFGPAAMVSDLDEKALERFARDMIGKGLSSSYASRILSVLAAGMRHGRVDVRIPYSLEWVQKVAPGGKARRKVALPTDGDFKKMLSAPISEPLFRWMLLSLATGARPEAIIDLTPAQRRDGLLDLNPPGRAQNKKHRPIVREPAALTPWLDAWGSATDLTGRYVAYASVESVKTALERLASPETGLGVPVSSYSFRHKVTTVLRRSKRNGVTEDDIAMQLGHRRPHLRTTGGYGEFDPDYLESAAKALSGWLKGLDFTRNLPAKTASRDETSGRYLRKSMT